MASNHHRPAAVAGLFYPDGAEVLAAQMAHLLAASHGVDEVSAVKALIAPHAGYVYSGPVAASAYRNLLPLRERIRRVLLLGPAHRVPLRGMALPSCEAFDSPLGAVPIDAGLRAAALALPAVAVNDLAHAEEHALEVQLPFLQTVLERFELLPVVVGLAEPEHVATLIETLWGGPETLVVVSSDLSHYYPYAQARGRDQLTCDRVLRLEACVDHEQACGATAINGLLLAARNHHLVPHLLDLRNSGDTAGDRSRVVGYAAFAFNSEARATH